MVIQTCHPIELYRKTAFRHELSAEFMGSVTQFGSKDYLDSNKFDEILTNTLEEVAIFMNWEWMYRCLIIA